MDIKSLAGVGPKTAVSLNKLNIFTTKDLINHYPFRYNFYHIKNILDNDLNDKDLIKVRIESNPIVSYIKRNFNRMSFKALNQNILFNVVIFNRAFQKNNLTIGKEIYICGKYDEEKNTFIANDLKFSLPDNLIEPVYHLASGINHNLLQKLLLQVDFNEVQDIIPNYLNERYGFISKQEAVKLIHFPNNINDIKKAELKLIYEELFVFMFKILYSKNINTKSLKNEKNFDEDKINCFIDNLPFKLTNDQKLSVDDILNDIKSNKQMNRLIIGDVGSGN